MREMIIDIVPFETYQNVWVCDTDNKETIILGKVRTDEIFNYPCLMFSKYNFSKVILKGNENYCKKVKEDILKRQNENFNKQFFDVEIKGE